MAELGGAIAVLIQWDCNLDHSIDLCKPEFKCYRVKEKKIF